LNKEAHEEKVKKSLNQNVNFTPTVLCLPAAKAGCAQKACFRSFFWVDLIFEVEKLTIFQLQKLNQPI
jgi:hypothetical protein